MKTIILSILFLGLSAIASEPVQTSPSEATVALNCDHSVPGTSCPAKYSAGGCKTILCDSQVKDGSGTTPTEGTK